jgi:hypothetical protein
MVKLICNFGGIMSVEFIKDAAERAVRTFFQGYLGAWLATGADFDGLVDVDNLKVGVVAVALSIAMSMGLRGVGHNKESGSVL